MNSNHAPSALPSFISHQTPHIGWMRSSGGQMTSWRPEVSSMVNVQALSCMGKIQMRHQRNYCLSSKRVPVLFVPVSGEGYFIQN